MASDMAAHYRQFLAGLILSILTGTATVWYFTDFFLALSYCMGAASVLIFTKAAPTYNPEIETDEDAEQQPGFQ